MPNTWSLKIQLRLQATGSAGMFSQYSDVSQGHRRGTNSSASSTRRLTSLPVTLFSQSVQTRGRRSKQISIWLAPEALGKSLSLFFGSISPYKLPAWFLRFNQILSKVKIFCLKINSGKTGTRRISDFPPALIKGGSFSKLLDSCNSSLEYGLMFRRKHTSLDLTVE